MKSKSKTLREIMSAGKIGDWNIAVTIAPRIIATKGGQKFLLSARTGRTAKDDTFPINRLREILTVDRASTRFCFTAVDRQTLEKETGFIQIIFNGYTCTDKSGTIKAGRLISRINTLSDATGEMRNAEQLAGLESNSKGRIVYNVEGSTNTSEVAGFDRTIENDVAVLWINTLTGEWYAQRKDAALDQMGIMAEVGLENLTTHDLIDAALATAPRVEAEF